MSCAGGWRETMLADERRTNDQGLTAGDDDQAFDLLLRE